VCTIVAPLAKAKFGNKLAYLNAFHGGIGFRTNEQTVVLEFYAVNGIGGAVFPTLLNPNSTSISSIQWHNEAVVGYINAIEKAYWTKSVFMGIIDGVLFNKFCCWLPTYLSAHPTYQLFNVYRPGVPNTQFIRATTCVDFVWDAFYALHTLGASLNPVLSPQHDYVNLYTLNAPEPLNPQSAQDVRELIGFYQSLYEFSGMATGSKNKSLTELVKALQHQTNNTAYVYVNGTYYRMVFSAPYMQFVYTVQPLPTNPKAPDSIPFENSAVCAATRKQNSGPLTQTINAAFVSRLENALIGVCVFLGIVCLLCAVWMVRWYRARHSGQEVNLQHYNKM